MANRSLMRISKVIPYVFFLVAGLNLIELLGVLPVYQKKYPSQVSNGGPSHPLSVEKMLRDNPSMSSEDLVLLLKNAEPKEPPAHSEDKDCEYCRKAVDILKSETEARTQAERDNRTKSRVTFGITFLVGTGLFFLKSKKFGIRAVPDNDNRESIINFIEFGFGIAVLAVNLFL